MIYLISPPQFELDDFLPLLDEVLATGLVESFQLRLKNTDYTQLSDADIEKNARAIFPICIKHNVAFIINDNVNIAKAVDADGLHLGEDDISVKQAREILGDEKIIGASCYDSKHLAFTAGEQGADYVAFGAFYPTNSKPAEKLRQASTELLEFWAENADIPCVAIGGINADNVNILREAGADFVAVISYVWNHPDGAVEAIKKLAK